MDPGLHILCWRSVVPVIQLPSYHIYYKWNDWDIMWHVSADDTEMQCFSVLELQEVSSQIHDGEGGRGYKVDFRESLLSKQKMLCNGCKHTERTRVFVARNKMLLTVIIWNIIFSQVITFIDILQKTTVCVNVLEAHPQQNLWRQSMKVCWSLCSMLNEDSLVHGEIVV